MSSAEFTGPVGLSFGEVVDVLSSLYEVHAVKRATFVSRLQQLQRLGIPPSTNVGRSSKARYGFSEVITLVACLDLLDCGVTPAVISMFFVGQEGNNLGTFFDEAKGNFARPIRTARSGGLDLYLLFQAGSLAYLTTPTPDLDPDRSVLRVEGDAKVLKEITAKPSIVLNITTRLTALENAIRQALPDRAADLISKA